MTQWPKQKQIGSRWQLTVKRQGPWQIRHYAPSAQFHGEILRFVHPSATGRYWISHCQPGGLISKAARSVYACASRYCDTVFARRLNSSLLYGYANKHRRIPRFEHISRTCAAQSSRKKHPHGLGNALPGCNLMHLRDMIIIFRVCTVVHEFRVTRSKGWYTNILQCIEHRRWRERSESWRTAICAW